jgi:hypothetical protein
MPSTGRACWMLDDGRAPTASSKRVRTSHLSAPDRLATPGSRTADDHGAEAPRPQPAQRYQERGARSRGGTAPPPLYALARPADGRTPARPGATGGHRARNRSMSRRGYAA